MGFGFTFQSHDLLALPSGGLFWPAQRALVISDLHFGKSERIARRGWGLLPPYDTRATLERLEADIARYDPALVIALGDSFDDLTAARALAPMLMDRLRPLKAGRRWVWILGNHDAGPIGMAGEALAEIALAGLTFRHIATSDGMAEVSGHYHPKARLSIKGRVITRAAFLYDARRLILPAYGTYTGGLLTHDPVLGGLMGAEARAILTGAAQVDIPMPR